MYPWSTEKLLSNIEARDKQIDCLNEQLSETAEQRDDETKRVDACVKFLKTLLNPEEFGWAVSQEVRSEVKKTLINIGEYYETVGIETKVG